MNDVSLEEVKIPGYDDYTITRDGTVYSYKHGKKKLLSPSSNSRGYLRVGLSSNGECKIVPIHKLMEMTFMDGPKPELVIDHINTVRTDNRLENLRQVTQKENCNNPLTVEHATISGKNTAEKNKNNPIWIKKNKEHITNINSNPEIHKKSSETHKYAHKTNPEYKERAIEAAQKRANDNIWQRHHRLAMQKCHNTKCVALHSSGNKLEFDSIGDCEKYFNLSHGTIWHRIKTNCMKDGWSFHIVDK